MKSQVRITGNLEIFNCDGNNVSRIDIDNLVVKSGKDFIAKRVAGTSVPLISLMAVGTQNTAPTVDDTELGTEIANITLTSTVVNENVITYSATFAAGVATGNLTEAGLFNSAGDMLSHAQFNEINKTSSNAIIIAWNIHII